MSHGPDDPSGALDGAGRERLSAMRSAGDLSELARVVGTDTGHDAYVAAKPEWRELRGRELGNGPHEYGGIPGARVVVDGHAFHVHGVTHAGTDAERAFLREHVADLRNAGATVYCEQGIRSMYFQNLSEVCEMDDYRWAMVRCRTLDVESHVEAFPEVGLDGVVADLASAASQFQDAAFSLIHSGRDVYGETFARALGDVAADFLRSHEDLATGDDFESFRRNRRAAEDPANLDALQRYYETAFLPQPLEREWLRRHDPELELVTHARNERMADYALYHNEEATDVHLVVGAAHQPGVRYYLERVRDGERDVEFEAIE